MNIALKVRLETLAYEAQCINQMIWLERAKIFVRWASIGLVVIGFCACLYIVGVRIHDKIEVNDKRPLVLETVDHRTRQVVDRLVVFGKKEGADMSLEPRIKRLVE
jgi:hypothetical protein